MTTVTTSRKPLPEVRSLARDLAFAIGGRYITRGKTGLGELFSLDPSVLIASKNGPFFLIEVFCNEESVASVTIRSFTVDHREGEIVRGLRTAERSIVDVLKGEIDAVSLDEDLPRYQIVFDGTQRKRYVLDVIP
jgi:U3 small nucleolar ribonucleoprotein protein IMP4